MKKILGIVLLAIVFITTDYAQAENLRNKYFRLSYSSTKMTYDDFDITNKSKYGVSMTYGKSFYLHKNPIANAIYFGIDITWMDLIYTNYKTSYYDYDLGLDYDMDYYDMDYDMDYDEESSITTHQAEYAMHIGPSIHIYPIGKLHVEGYFRYAPTFSMIIEDGNFYGNYATYFVGGGAITYNCLGIGAEARFGNCKYKSFTNDDDSGSGSTKMNFKGYRVYLSFRF